MLEFYFRVFAAMHYKLQQGKVVKWKLTLIGYLSAFLSLILMAIVLIIIRIFDLDKDPAFAQIISILIYFPPAVAINYFLFIYKNRYEVILKKYPEQKEAPLIYFLVFVLLFFLFAVIINRV